MNAKNLISLTNTGITKIDSPHWYAIYTTPRAEKKVAERLHAAGFVSYCPTYVTIRQWSDRLKKVKIPVFTGYVFVKIRKCQRIEILQDQGALNFVYHLGRPARILDIEMEQLQFFLGDLKANQKPLIRHIHPGDQISVVEGPFKGKEGFVKKATHRKAFVILKHLGLVVELDKNQVALHEELLHGKI